MQNLGYFNLILRDLETQPLYVKKEMPRLWHGGCFRPVSVMLLNGMFCCDLCVSYSYWIPCHIFSHSLLTIVCWYVSNCWAFVIWNVVHHVLWPPGLLVAPLRASCMSREARRWSCICTTQMICPRKMRVWEGERWYTWRHITYNSLPYGGHH